MTLLKSLLFYNAGLAGFLNKFYEIDIYNFNIYCSEGTHFCAFIYITTPPHFPTK